MRGAEPFLKRDGAHHRGHQHEAARFHAAWIAHDDGEMVRGEFRAAEGDGVADGMKAFGKIGLDVVGEGVHAGTGGDVRWKLEREFRIDDGR